MRKSPFLESFCCNTVQEPSKTITSETVELHTKGLLIS